MTGPPPPGLIGRSLRRQEDPRLLRGKGRYVADVVRPGLLHLVVVRSPHAHARIAGIDVGAARRAPGVVAVLTAADLEGIGPLPVLAHPPGQRQSDFPVLPSDRAV
jgi:carbon-monoxide dehydrogenase large subunit